jgi:hypothetical protein
MAVGGIHGVILVLNTLKRLVIELAHVNCMQFFATFGSRDIGIGVAKWFNLALFTSITHLRV